MAENKDRMVTAFPAGTVVHYRGVPCQLLSVTPYYSATMISNKEPKPSFSFADRVKKWFTERVE